MSEETGYMNPVEHLVPHSEAANAYDLLSDVIRVVEEEPRRLYMNQWLIIGVRMDSVGEIWLDGSRDTMKPPACGTVGCIAGWVTLLKRETVVELMRGDTQDRAFALIMGPDPDQQARKECNEKHGWSFDFEQSKEGQAWSERGDSLRKLFHSFPSSLVSPGTPEYVQSVVQSIKHFQSRFENELRAVVYPR